VTPNGAFLVNTELDSATAPIILLQNWASRDEEIALARRIGPHWSLAFIGSASARDDQVGGDAGAEALSITRLEGSRWRGGRYGALSQDLLRFMCWGDCGDRRGTRRGAPR
jgi:hypothetical protein